MEKRKFIWLIPVFAISLTVAFLYPISGEEQSEVNIPVDEIYGYRWILHSFVIDGEEIQIIDNSGISIQFDEENLLGSSGCNTYFGDYDISGEYQIFAKSDPDQDEEQIGIGGTISLDSIASTEMACVKPGIMEQESQFLSVLNEVTEFEATELTLKLFNEDQQIVIIFEQE